MAKTITQIQNLIDSQSLDARQLINLIADYLQSNPGGGGNGIYGGSGTLPSDVIVDLDNHNLALFNGSLDLNGSVVKGDIFLEQGKTVILISPDLGAWKIVVADDGTLSTVSAAS